jgi:hypothetical protein
LAVSEFERLKPETVSVTAEFVPFACESAVTATGDHVAPPSLVNIAPGPD